MTGRSSESRFPPTETSRPAQICAQCGAAQRGPAENCWLCHQALSTQGTSLATEASLSEPQSARLSYSLSTLFLVVTLAAVILGLFAAVPGLGVAACIVVGPVLFRTLKVVRHREAVGQSVGAGEKIALFVGSFAVASVIAVVASIAAFSTFCSVCVSVIAMQGNGGQEAILFVFLFFVFALLSVWGLIRSIKWSRRRYRREMVRKEGPQ